MEELVQGTSTHHVLFVTIAFELGIDCNDIRRVVHIGVPYSMDDCPEVGKAGRDGLPAGADICDNRNLMLKVKARSRHACTRLLACRRSRICAY